MPSYIIDTKTTEHKLIIRRLKKLRSILSVQDNGQYINCPECSQLSIESTLSDAQLDNWLWKNNLDYIGVVNGN